MVSVATARDLGRLWGVVTTSCSFFHQRNVFVLHVHFVFLNFLLILDSDCIVIEPFLYSTTTVLNQRIPDNCDDNEHNQRDIKANQHSILLVHRLSLPLEDLVWVHIHVFAWNQTDLVSGNFVDLVKIREEGQTEDPLFLIGRKDSESGKDPLVSEL